MNAPRRVSAGDTFFLKFIIPTLFLAMTVAVVGVTSRLLAAATSQPLAPQLGAGIIALQVGASLACIAMALSTVWSNGRLMRVALGDSSLHVSNFRREIVVPLSDIVDIDQSEDKSYRVAIKLTRDTEFGRRIIFTPIGFFPPRPHPIIAELRAAVAAAKHA